MTPLTHAQRQRKIKAMYRRWLQDEKFLDSIADPLFQYSDTMEMLRNLGTAIAYGQAYVNAKGLPKRASEFIATDREVQS